ncbi:MAG: hypothetical protein ACKO96_47125, partial [Flammeovirgaceae bacterium]
PDSYYSDGSWIWPSYFPYYLIKFPRYPIDSEFIDFLLARNFQPSKILNKEEKDLIESDLLKKIMR